MKQAASLWLLCLFSYRDNVFDLLIQPQVYVHHMLYGSLFDHSFKSSTFCDPFILWSRYVGSIKGVLMRWWILRLTVKTLANLMASGWFFPGMVKLKSFAWIFFHNLWSKLVHFYGYRMNFLAVSRLTANYTRPLIKFDTFFLEPRYSSPSLFNKGYCQ